MTQTITPARAFGTVVFDAYGTLLDVHAIARLAEQFFPGQGDALSRLWREKQIDYTRLRTLCGVYQPFWSITQDALQYACLRLRLSPSLEQRSRLLSLYAHLPLYAEAQSVLLALHRRGVRMAVLSNANLSMLETALESAGVVDLFKALLSVDAVGKYKTAPEAYALASDFFALPPGEMLFVSGNGWDVCGAAWYGYSTFWVNREGVPAEELGVGPMYSGASLHDLQAALL